MFNMIIETSTNTRYLGQGTNSIDNLTALLREISQAFKLAGFKVLQQSKTVLAVDIAGEPVIYSIC